MVLMYYWYLIERFSRQGKEPERVSDYCLTPNEQFSAIILR